MPGTHLTPSERVSLETMLPFGLSQVEMAVRLGRSKSTISRELARNGGAVRALHGGECAAPLRAAP